MTVLKSFAAALPVSPSFPVRRYFLLFCLFWLGVAAFEFTQDYIDALLSAQRFEVMESLAFKTFWILFVPFSVLFFYGASRTTRRFPGSAGLAVNTAWTLVICFAHLTAFAFVLFVISGLIHYNPWSFSYLLTVKLSTRLYIGLTVYVTLLVVHSRMDRSSSHKEDKAEILTVLPVRNGKSFVPVSVDCIHWISAYGPYLLVHTENERYIISDSLKNIITRLPDPFKRIHRSTIVNTERIKELRSRLTGDYDVTMEDGKVLRLSRNYAKPLKGILL